MILLSVSTDSGIGTDYMLPYAPFVWKYKLSFVEWPDYFDDWDTVSGAPAQRVSVSSVKVSDTLYSQKISINDCIADEESWFFDTGSQVIYIHVCHDCLPASIYMTVYNTTGFTDGDIYYDRADIEYLPLLRSSPTINKQTDSLTYNKVSLINQKVTLANEAGDFDSYIDAPIPGGIAVIKFLPSVGSKLYSDSYGFIIADHEGYPIAAPDNPPADIYTGIITGDSFSETDFQLSISDIRSGLKISVPPNNFTVTEFPDMPDDFSGKVIPDGFGACRGVKATPITGTVTSSPIDFKWCEVATSITSVHVKQNDTWTEVTPTATDHANGEFTLAIADCVLDGTVLECKVDGVMRNYSNPGDIIAQMNAIYAGVPYDSSGYNQVVWASESAKLADIGICFSERKDMLDWIEKIQGGSDKGFIYTTQGDGKRIITVDDITEMPTLTIRKEDIKGEISADRDFKDFASTVTVKYNRDYESGRFYSEKNMDWQEYVKSKYRQEKDVNYDTYLIAEADATAKALDYANRLKDVKLTYSFTVSGIDYFGLQLFQIVTAEMDKETRPIFGTRTCQVLGIKYNFKDETIGLTLKEI